MTSTNIILPLDMQSLKHPGNMKANELIMSSIFKDMEIVCNNDSEKRAYLQGARQMPHALFMSNKMDLDTSSELYDLIDIEVQKRLS